MSNLAALWSADSIAVVGATDRPGAFGRLPLSYLRRFGYQGEVYPVHPTAEAVGGLAAFPTLRDIPGPVDLAMLMVRADAVPDVLEDAAAAGVRTVVITSSGFAEAGPEGLALQERALRSAGDDGLRVVGPNCIGSVNFHTGLMATFSPLFSSDSVPIDPGGLALVSQSGALGYGAVSLALERRLPLGWVVNTGNEADVNALEVLAELAERDDCDALLGYVEQMSDVRSLERLAAAGKPVALIKAGDSELGGHAAASHTAALAGSHAVIDAAFHKFGIARAEDIDELIDIGEVFLQGRKSRRSRVAVVTTSGGSGIMAADALSERDMQLAVLSASTNDSLQALVPDYGSITNPVDVTAKVMADRTMFDQCLDAVLADDGVDAVIAAFCVLTGESADDVVESLTRAAGGTDKPLVVVRTGAEFLAPTAAPRLRDARIPTFTTPRQAVTALAGLRDACVDTPFADQPQEHGTRGTPGLDLDEPALKEFLESAGCRVPRGGVARDAGHAEAMVERLGGKAVMKAVVPGLLHKSEVGGVRVGVSPDVAASVFQELEALGGRVLVEEMVPGGIEMLVGAQSTPLGPSITAATGGIYSEVLDDAVTRLAPVDEAGAQAMLSELRGAILLDGVRGDSPVARDRFVETVVTVSQLVASWPFEFELDLNPVTVTKDDAVVLDAALVTRGGEDALQVTAARAHDG